jgi:glutamyl-tRNA(Gln) amidotransferase subunit E
MYPETDVLPVIIDERRWNGIIIPELLTQKAGRYAQEYGIDLSYALQLISSEKLPLFEQAVKEKIKPKLAAFTILSTVTELRREGIEISAVSDDSYLAMWKAVESRQAAKEAIPDLLRLIAAGSSVDAALAKLGPAVSRADLESIVKKIITSRSGFVMEKGKAALGPLMGVVMAEVRGTVDGKVVSEILRKEIDAELAGKRG